MKRFAAIVFVFLASFTATAQEGGGTSHDGNKLLPMCQAAVASLGSSTWKDTHESYNTSFCYGLIEGITMVSPDICPAAGVTIGQELRVVVKFLEDHPASLNQDESSLLLKALSRAFPCPKG